MTIDVNGRAEVSADIQERASDLSARAAEFALTEAYQAERFADAYGDILRYDHRSKQWFIYDGHLWRVDQCGQVDQLAVKAARLLHAEASAIGDTPLKTTAQKMAKFCQSSNGVSRVLSLAKSLPPIATDGNGWNRDPWLLGTPDAVVNLRTGYAQNGRPEDMVSLSVRAHFDFDAQCSRWEQFVDEVFGGDTELVAYMQRVLGYALTGDATEQVWWLLHGDGANGKSTMLDVLTHVLGDYAQRVPFSMFELPQRPVPDDVATLVSKRFVTASESIEATKLNEARIKSMTGGDQQTARHLYGKWFRFDPEFKLFLCANHKPKVYDESHGFWRRVHVIPFTERFEKSRRDPALAEKLRAESSGILTWLIVGCLLWQADGLKPPEKVLLAAQAYERENNPLNDFVADCCELGDGHQCMARALFEGYTNWLRTARPAEKPLTETAFGKSAAKLFTKRRTSQAHIYEGVRLRIGNE